MYRDFKTVSDVMDEVDKIQDAIRFMMDSKIIVMEADADIGNLRDDVVCLLANYRETIKKLPVKV